MNQRIGLPQQFQKISCILDSNEDNTGGLYLSSVEPAENKDTLQKNNIKFILSVSKGVILRIPKDCLEGYKLVEIYDSHEENILHHFNEGVEFIEKNIKLGNVLVHCMAGVSRSASMIMAYIMKTRGLTFERSFGFVKQKRAQVNPNAGFQKQLRLFQKELKIEDDYITFDDQKEKEEEEEKIQQQKD